MGRPAKKPERIPSNNGVPTTPDDKWADAGLRRWAIEQAIVGTGKMTSAKDGRVVIENAKQFVEYIQNGE